MNCRTVGFAALVCIVVACSSDPEPTPGSCGLADFRFEDGSPDGHPDPFGAKAAGQARAGRIHDPSQIVQGPLSRGKVRVGDFALANDRIALYIEAEGRAEGYAPFGGDIVAIEPVGDDGRPRGLSAYGETLVALSRQSVKPDKVSVIADGADGKAAIVRTSGVLVNIPFLDTFTALSPAEYGFPAALDYVLEPGAEKVLLRIHVANTTTEAVDFANVQRVGFFQASRSSIFTEANGYGPQRGENPWVAFDSNGTVANEGTTAATTVRGSTAFAFRSVAGPIRSELEISGFQLFSVKGLAAQGCEKNTADYLEIMTGAPGIDGLLETKRRVLGEPPGREIRGVLREAESGALLGSAWIHATGGGDRYLTRALTNDAGEFVLHVPAGPVSLTPTLMGWAVPTPTAVADGAGSADLTLPKRAVIEVKVTDSVSGEALPARIQVLPQAPPMPAPPPFGLREEVDGRLWQALVMTGNVALPVPPGSYRVVVSRGYEYELVDMAVNATTTATALVDAKLRRSVDTTGVMCADFHEHSFFSADSSDPVEYKVRGAVADGLDIPVSSEHEWVIDFQPVVQRLGVTKFAFGMPSSELTTFSWGHFGIVPIFPREEAPNNGAIDWVGKQPAAFFDQVNALPEKPVLIVNHPSGGSFTAYFSAANFNRVAASGSPDLWSDAFGAVEVFNDSDFDFNRNASVGDWFALLNAGKTPWAVGNSDSHDGRTNFVGYPRTCLRFGHDDPTKLSPEIVRDVLRSGAATVSGGLYMTVEGPGGIGPGGTATSGAYKVVVQSTSWFSASTLEVIVDGLTTETIPLSPLPLVTPGRRYEATVNVAAADSRPRHWVVFHAKGDGDLAPLHPKRKPFAVSNPIFF